MYGCHADTPIDLQLRPKTENTDILLDQLVNLHIKKITEQLHQQRLQAQNNIQEAQRRQKEYHDRYIKTIEFKIGNQVLLYELAKKK
ncbi:16558_t:CDS:1, partial [Gigaspora margarita]